MTDTSHSFIQKIITTNTTGVTEKQVHFSLSDYRDADYVTLNVQFADKLATAVSKRKAEYLAGRYCAQKALLQLCGEEATISSGEKREPIWPENIIGSITHADSIAAAVVGEKDKWLGLGIDCEKTINTKTFRSIRKSICTLDELEHVQTIATEPEMALTIIFSAKESIFKALFPSVRRYFDFSAAKVLDVNESAIEFKLMESLADDFHEGYSMSVNYEMLTEKHVMTRLFIPRKNVL